jgi:hypothetical protein
MESNTTFFFFFIPLQFGVAIYLTYFEVKKLIATRDKSQIPIVLYNLFQVLMPFIDLT